MSDESYDVVRWITDRGRRCAAMLPRGTELSDRMREQFSKIADERPVQDGENPEFHFTVSRTGRCREQ